MVHITIQRAAGAAGAAGVRCHERGDSKRRILAVEGEAHPGHAPGIVCLSEQHGMGGVGIRKRGGTSA